MNLTHDHSHSACDEMLKKHGLNTPCCACSWPPHKCTISLQNSETKKDFNCQPLKPEHTDDDTVIVTGGDSLPLHFIDAWPSMDKEWWDTAEYWTNDWDSSFNIEAIVAEAERKTWEEVKSIAMRDQDDCAWLIDQIDAKLSSLTKK